MNAKSDETWSRDTVLKSSALRGQGRYDESIKNILENIAGITDDAATMGAYRELLFAAEAKGDEILARSAANKLRAIEPDLPSIQKYFS
jgi:hypothetical protein